MEKSNVKRKSSEIDEIEIKENAKKKIDVMEKENTEENKETKEKLTSEEEKKEEHYVHDVYEAIAPHFSDTRYKPWPVVDKFLTELKPGLIGVDVGCGNGKYLGINKNVYIIGSDRCSNLIKICRERGYESLVADNLSLPYRSNAFDFAISIAVIHHFTTPERRRDAIEEILRVLKKGSKVLIFVWAFEQERKKYDEQDVLIPWHIPKKKYLNNKNLNKKDYTESEKSEHLVKYERYYHLFKKGELDDLVNQIEIGKVVETGYDRDNWYVIAEII